MAATAPRVLVVDDDPRLVRGLKIILRNAGYDVLTAHTTVDAIRTLTADPPDLFVVDLPSRPRYFVTESGVGYRLCDPNEALA